MSGELAYVSFTVNGVAQELHVRPEEMLIDVLRDRMALTGAKLSCDLGACGACTVLLDGRPVSSCATFAWQADGAEVRTV
ncbi:MAG: aerobic-type carbon monoxide dehydrogenase small subunit (CoxS/CutS family), partial [Alphaproteobacteria bacterium]